MAYAAYAEVFGANTDLRPNRTEWWVIPLRVPMDQARRAREVLARHTRAGVLRCHPHPWRHEVEFEVLLSAEQHGCVVDALLTWLPQAQWGRPQHWSRRAPRPQRPGA